MPCASEGLGALPPFPQEPVENSWTGEEYRTLLALTYSAVCVRSETTLSHGSSLLPSTSVNHAPCE